MEEQVIQLVGNFTALAITLYAWRLSERRVDRYEERLFSKQARIDRRADNEKTDVKKPDVS